MKRAIRFSLYGIIIAASVLAGGCGSAASRGTAAVKDSVAASAPTSESDLSPASPSANGVPPTSSVAPSGSGSVGDIPSNAPVQLPRGLDAPADGSGRLPSDVDNTTSPAVMPTGWDELDQYFSQLGDVVTQAVSSRGNVARSAMQSLQRTAERLAGDGSEGRKGSQPARAGLVGMVASLAGGAAVSSPASQLRSIRGVLQMTNQVLTSSQPANQEYVHTLQQMMANIDAVIAVVK